VGLSVFNKSWHRYQTFSGQPKAGAIPDENDMETVK
jgi:hypothetical protein